MKYGEIIYVSFGSILSHLCMQSDRSLGKLARHALERTLRKPHLRPLPERLAPLMEKIQRGLMVMYEDRLPPAWTILEPRMREAFPAFVAMRDRDLGLLIRGVLLELSPDAEERETRLPSGAEAHMKRLREWLNTDIQGQRELESLMNRAMQSARSVREAHGDPELSERDLTAMVCAQILARTDLSRTPAEAGLLRVATSLCLDPRLSGPDLKKLVAEAVGGEPDAPRKEDAADRPEVEAPVPKSELPVFSGRRPVDLGA